MKNQRTLKILQTAGNTIGGLTFLEMVPFLPASLSIPIIAISNGLVPLLEVVGDFLDNKKIDGSFKIGQ